MPNQNDLNSYNFQSNPYMELLGGGGAPQGAPQGMPQGMPQGGGEPQMANPNQTMQEATAQGMAGAQEEQSQLEKGVNPDGLKLIMGAINGLERFVADSQNKEDIMIVRGVIAALSRLIAKLQSDQIDQIGI